MRPLDDTASPKRLNPPDCRPFERVKVGGRVVVLRTRETVAVMQRRFAVWSAAFTEFREAGRKAKALRDEGDTAGAKAEEARSADAEERLERIHAGLMLLAWWDPSGDLDVRERWDKAEFAGAAEPLEAVGAEVIDELMGYGWEPVHVNEAGAAVAQGYAHGLGLMPDPREVDELATVFQEPTETAT